MPAPITSTSRTRTVDKHSTLKPRELVKKKRVVRRRGRAPGDIGSDDEIERELGTDSESENVPSSVDSDSDSDTEPASDDVIPNGHFTPSTSQSPADRGVNSKVDAEPFFAPPGGNWSEMVADETANGPADLPVIEFADLEGHDKVPPASRPKKAKKTAKNSRSGPVAPAPPPQANGHQRSNGTEGTSHDILASLNPSPPRRPPGQTARQAYQQRLESDPSYVPTVGGFWGHDDRLLDKDLRSLSGWWRGRWQGRGRGGFMKGRGRGGYFGPNSDAGEQPEDGSALDVPPIERAWGHDGFEEMKKREEQRRAAHHSQPQAQPFHGPGSFRGSRGFGAVRGGRGGFNRGRFVDSSGPPSANSGRIWYNQKPELMWTKQHEGFLYFEQDPSLKPRQGQHQGILVKLPGTETKVARAQSKRYSGIRASTQRPATASVIASDHDDRTYTVNLPKRSEKEKVNVVTEETPIEDVFKVRTDLVQMEPIPLELVPPAAPVAEGSHALAQRTHEAPPHSPDLPLAASSKSQPKASIRLQLEQLSVEPDIYDPARLAKTEEAVMRNPSTEQEEDTSAPTMPPESGHASLPSLPPMFSPPLSQPSPYGSPYGYAPALPPGIAMNQHGVPYELATGRPVYIQAPPPPPLYNPRPVMHSHLPPAFLPGHMSHHSHSAMSPDFLASASHTPPMNSFIDPTTGMPIFSFPRQTSRIEIRAPPESTEVKSPGKAPAPRSSVLRTAASSFQPSPRASTDTSANGYFPSLSTPPENGALPSYAPVEGLEGSADALGGHQHDQAMMYQPYQQQFYYPTDAYGYAHNPYMDMSQVRPYYPPPPEGTVYY